MIFEPRWAPNGAWGRVDAEDQMYRVVKVRDCWFGVGEPPTQVRGPPNVMQPGSLCQKSLRSRSTSLSTDTARSPIATGTRTPNSSSRFSRSPRSFRLLN
jgi:hypothetical protein